MFGPEESHWISGGKKENSLSNYIGEKGFLSRLSSLSLDEPNRKTPPYYLMLTREIVRCSYFPWTMKQILNMPENAKSPPATMEIYIEVFGAYGPQVI